MLVKRDDATWHNMVIEMFQDRPVGFVQVYINMQEGGFQQVAMSFR